MIRYIYCERWAYSACEPAGVLSAAAARTRFEGKVPDPDDWFTVAGFLEDAGGASTPEFVLEVTPGAEFVYAHLVDQWQRICFIYNFRDVEGRLFLFNRVEYTYPEDERYLNQAQASRIESILFKPDGYMRRRLKDKSKATTEEWEYKDVDMVDNWELKPEFGRWGALGRYRG